MGTEQRVEVINPRSSLFRQRYTLLSEDRVGYLVENWNGDQLWFTKNEMKKL